MLFSSIVFLYYFLPIVLLLYLAAPKSMKNSVLLVCSLVFYAWGEPRYVLLMAGSILVGYVCGLQIEKYRGSKAGRVWVALSVLVSLGFLFYFKYVDFFLDSFAKVTGLPVKLLGVALPIGISFYTFQMLSYTIDVGRGQVKAQRNLLHLATYIAMFPQLIAGPIVRYSDIAESLVHRRHTVEETALGIRRFVLGLGKKVIIANSLGELVNALVLPEASSVLSCWGYAVAASLFIYFDFSGYSDMAIGLGHMFGFHFPENFNYPFLSKSMTEFWRRWHMTLGGWFRDYLYIPLGGNRVSRGRQFFNIFLVWLATGLWHGAAWNYVVWGLYFAVLLLLEKFLLKDFLDKHGIFARLYFGVLILVSFVIFHGDSMADSLARLGGMFGGGGMAFVSDYGLYCLRNYAGILIVALAGATPLGAWFFHKLQGSRWGAKVCAVAEPVLLAAVFVAATAFLVNGSYNPFLYFRF